ncbi:hypothetical protein SAMN02745244_03485 [Tessaracoccus bendigoensis DSM 12906]|uniref:Uncharacterized protein n=1 Tax=Tessaracoccus bendigoensis DSM 12906 TaxID=1123357 RepID=A0A1M6MWX9_9ACTN|nr:hypothetical protein SAMN02745244_03485 [Tessaracoccus bendigoensis DSM 12906]
MQVSEGIPSRLGDQPSKACESSSRSRLGQKSSQAFSLIHGASGESRMFVSSLMRRRRLGSTRTSLRRTRGFALTADAQGIPSMPSRTTPTAGMRPAPSRKGSRSSPVTASTRAHQASPSSIHQTSRRLSLGSRRDWAPATTTASHFLEPAHLLRFGVVVLHHSGGQRQRTHRGRDCQRPGRIKSSCCASMRAQPRASISPSIRAPRQ